MNKFVELTTSEMMNTNGGGVVTVPVVPTYIATKIAIAIIKAFSK